jgi:hypothetical protein
VDDGARTEPAVRLGVVLARLNQIKWVSPLLREARRRGHETVILLDRSVAGRGDKATATVDTLPLWLHALVDRVVPLETITQLDASVSVTRRAPASGIRTRLQTSVSDVLGMTVAELGRWDAVYTWSETWTDWWRDQVPRFGDPEPFEHFVPVGYPLAEHLARIDRAEVRQTFGITASRVVVYLPFPFGVHAQPWSLRYGYRLSPWGDRATVKAVRAACDRLGAELVVKSRTKTPVPGYLRDAADVVVERDEPGEPTLLRLLSVATLMVHHLSSGIAEAALVGVRALGIVPPGWTAYANRGRDFDVDAADSFYGWTGLSEVWAQRSVRTWALEVGGTAVDSVARAAYLARYLGVELGPPSVNLLNDLEKRRA